MNALDVLKAQASSSGLTATQLGLLNKLALLIGPYVACPNVINSVNIADCDGGTFYLADGQNITISGTAWSQLQIGITFMTAAGTTNTVSLTDGAVKENDSGVSAADVVMAKGCIYTVTRSPHGSPKLLFTGAPVL